MSYRFLPAAIAAAAFLVSACGEAPEPAPDPKALEQFIAKVEAQDRAARAQAVAEARRKEQARIEAAEKRLARYKDGGEQVLDAPVAAGGSPDA